MGATNSSFNKVIGDINETSGTLGNSINNVLSPFSNFVNRTRPTMNFGLEPKTIAMIVGGVAILLLLVFKKRR